jgi:cyclopropane fatty-acyl-phospholipid synthase-like methyltransferase
VLRQVITPGMKVLEIASGSGEHVVHFARAFPKVKFQPSDPDPAARVSIAAWTEETGLKNIAAPLDLDVVHRAWPAGPVDVILCINMVHISPWPATVGLVEGAKRILNDNGVLFLYGPYLIDGETAPSNIDFDASLRSRNPNWGVRELRHVQREAEARGLVMQRWVEMPANNLSVVFQKQ